MRIEVLYFEGCPNYLAAVERLKRVLREEGFDEHVSSIEVRDEESARSLNFLGSPTIRINGNDIEHDARTSADVGLACRRYSGGLPPEDMIRAALLETRGN